MRDHCHYSGKYRGALHYKCNLQLKRTRAIQAFAHNLSRYDSHLFVKRLADTEGDVTCIPRNEEKYITFTKSVLVGTVKKEDGKEVNIYSVVKFVDTFNFMHSSVAKLAGNMRKTDFKHTLKYFENNSAMLRKCVYLYKYMTDVSKFKETKLPSEKDFVKILDSGMIVGSGVTVSTFPQSENSPESTAHARK